MSLVELLVGLAIASLVSLVVMTGSAAAARHARLAIHGARSAAILDDTLGAMLADIRAGHRWDVCAEARFCSAYAGGGKGMALMTNGQTWTVADGLLRCSARRCERVLDDVVAMDVRIDVSDGESIRCQTARAGLVRRARLIDVRLTLRDGRTATRSVALHP